MVSFILKHMYAAVFGKTKNLKKPECINDWKLINVIVSFMNQRKSTVTCTFCDLCICVCDVSVCV